MKVTCSHCGAQFSIDDAKVPPQGARLRCAKCHEFFVCPPPPAAKTPVPKRTLVPDAPPSAAAGPPPVPMSPADAAKPAAAVGANAVPLPDSQTAGLSENARSAAMMALPRMRRCRFQNLRSLRLRLMPWRFRMRRRLFRRRFLRMISLAGPAGTTNRFR